MKYNIQFWKWWTTANIGIWGTLLTQYYFNTFGYLLQYDITYISFMILAISLVFTIALFINYTKIQNSQNNIYWFTTDAVLSLGMTGTLIGFLVILGSAFTNIDPANTQNMIETLKIIATGMSTALLTTLTGILASMWMKLQLLLIENEQNK